MALTKVSYAMVDGAVANVLDFGAYNDGTNATQTTAAIQAALNSGAPAVYLPAGKYLVNSTIYIPTRTKLFGEYAAYNQYDRDENAGAVLYADVSAFPDQAAVLQAGQNVELGNIEIHNIVVDITRSANTTIAIRKENCNHFVMVNVSVSARFDNSTQIAYFNGNGTHGYFENIRLMGGKTSIYMDNTPGRECHDSVFNKVWMYPAALSGAICLYFPENGGLANTTWIMPYFETGNSGLVTGVKNENLAAPQLVMLYPAWDGSFANLWESLYPNRSKLIGSNLEDLSASFTGFTGRMINIGRQGSQLIEKFYLYDVGQEIQFGVDSDGFHFGRLSGGAAKISKIQGGKKTEVIGTVNAGATFTDTITVVGCTVGAPVTIGIDWTGSGAYTLTATVVNAVTVRYWLTNNDASPVDFGTRVLKAVVFNGDIT